MSKLERLNKVVEDTKVDYEAAYKAWDAAWDTYATWVKAKRELAEYLKEQQKNADVKDH
tara:strand:- start:41 stop:217 length:177 start_codon:yes stop_codon:yes gene_type:complete